MARAEQKAKDEDTSKGGGRRRSRRPAEVTRVAATALAVGAFVGGVSQLRTTAPAAPSNGGTGTSSGATGGAGQVYSSPTVAPFAPLEPATAPARLATTAPAAVTRRVVPVAAAPVAAPSCHGSRC